jgi:glycosyltransferase involved in cell wall biosynthesis
MDIAVVLPVYNERENLRALLEEIENALAPTSMSFEVIAIDDGSTDGSSDLLHDLAAEKTYLKAIFFRQNYGQSAAFDAGFRAATAKLIVTMDADLQNDPADIPRMIEVMESRSLDFVAGNRGQRKDGIILRRVPSRIANWLIRRVTGTKLRDLGCSLKLYRREVVEELRLYGEMHRFIGVLVEGLGARTAEIRVNHRPRRAGSSKYGITRTFKVLLDLLTVWFMRGYETKPIYVFGGIGMALGTGSVLLSVFVLWEKLSRGIWVHRNPLFILSMGMFLLAVQFLALGLLAEIMVRTYFESRHKSSYLIGERIGFEPASPAVEVHVEPWVRETQSRSDVKQGT